MLNHKILRNFCTNLPLIESEAVSLRLNFKTKI